MKFSPHKYQLEAINFLLAHKACALFLDCGLGKTVITLSTLAILKHRNALEGKTLIVAPKRPALTTWPNELRKWDHLKNLTYSNLCCPKNVRVKALQADADIYIINREMLPWLVDFYGKRWPFKTIILDELSSFKSLSARSKALVKVRLLANRVIGLTGTPASNGYMDLWMQFRIIDNGVRLGKTLGEYQRKYFYPISTMKYVVTKWGITETSRKEIDKQISDIALVMRASDLLDMPQLINITDSAYLDSEELTIYNNFKNEFVLDLEESDDSITAANAGVLTIKLTQLASGTLYTESEEKETIVFHDRKLEVLKDLVEAQNGKPVLIAYWFKSDKTRITEYLRNFGYSVGEINTPKDEEAWNAQNMPIALIHPAKAGHGLNLQSGGFTMIWFTLPWSLELYIQTVDRLYRQGQSSARVIMHHIITEDTTDEVVYKALRNKENVQNSLLESIKLHQGEH